MLSDGCFEAFAVTQLTFYMLAKGLNSAKFASGWCKNCSAWFRGVGICAKDKGSRWRLPPVSSQKPLFS